MNLKTFTKVAMIAAIYTVLTVVFAPLSFGPFQVRFAEGLTLLPLVYAPSIYGVTLGCFISNLIGAMTGANILGYYDAIFGTLATFLAAVLTYKLRDKKVFGFPLLSFLMPVVFNFVVIGYSLALALMPENIWNGTLIFGTEVAVGEVISLIIGWFVLQGLMKTNIFKEGE